MGQWCRADYPVLTWTEFEENAKASIDCLADEDLIKTAAGCLHEAGKVRDQLPAPKRFQATLLNYKVPFYVS